MVGEDLPSEGRREVLAQGEEIALWWAGGEQVHGSAEWVGTGAEGQGIGFDTVDGDDPRVPGPLEGWQADNPHGPFRSEEQIDDLQVRLCSHGLVREAGAGCEQLGQQIEIRLRPSALSAHMAEQTDELLDAAIRHFGSWENAAEQTGIDYQNHRGRRTL